MTTDLLGLCAACHFARRVESGRGSVFLRCGRHDEDARFPKYPRLPVTLCGGFVERTLLMPSDTQPPMPQASPPPPRQPSTRQEDLWQRVGGREVIERVTAEFYERVEADPELRPMFPEDMTEGRIKQAEFLEQWLGGEARYSAKYGHPRLRMRHFNFVIDQRGAGRWLKHMAEALRAGGVGEPEIAEILNGLGPLARHMVNVDDDVPRNLPTNQFLQ